MPKQSEKTWTQRVVEYGEMMPRLLAKKRQLGYRTFAEFARYMAVDFMQRHGEAPAEFHRSPEEEAAEERAAGSGSRRTTAAGGESKPRRVAGGKR